MRKLLVAGAMLATLVAMAAVLAPGALSGSGAHERDGVQLIQTFRRPEGQIVTEGLVAFGATEFTWAITGGTGAYSTAHGAVDVVETNGGVNATFSFHIIR